MNIVYFNGSFEENISLIRREIQGDVVAFLIIIIILKLIMIHRMANVNKIIIP